jgi:hypothetical protein
LGNELYLANFYTKNGYHTILFGESWMVVDHILIV